MQAQRVEICSDLAASCRAELAFYRELPDERLQPMIGRFTDLILQGLRGEDLDFVRSFCAELVARRRQQGMMLPEALATIRTLRRIYKRWVRRCASTPEAALDGSARVDEFFDELTAAVGALYQGSVEEARSVAETIDTHFRSFYLRTPVMMHSVDTETRLIAVSDRWVEVLGYGRDEVLGRRVVDFMDEESRQRVKETNLPALHREGALRETPMRFIKKDGSTIDVLASVETVRDSRGAPVQFLTVLIDITERLRAERALRESEESYRALVELSPFGTIVHRAGEVVYANSAALRLFGADRREDLVGTPALDRVHPSYRDQVRARVGRVLQDGEQVPSAEELLLKLDGTAFEGEVTGRPTIFEGLPAVQVVFIDISQRKRAEEARNLAEAQAQVIRAQEEALLALSTPLIPLGDGVVVMPLIGRITGERAARILETLAAGVAAQQARTAILDVTGIPEADAGVAEALVRAAQAIRLLGAEVVLTGIQPAFARTMVDLGVQLSGIITRATLRDGIGHALVRFTGARDIHGRPCRR
jgi:rsbT co-antagonist protein RsbR